MEEGGEQKQGGQISAVVKNQTKIMVPTPGGPGSVIKMDTVSISEELRFQGETACKVSPWLARSLAGWLAGWLNAELY